MNSMKKNFYNLSIIFFVSLCIGKSSVKSDEIQTVRLDWVEKWFSAWELTSKEVLSLPQDTPPEMLFFDEKYIYTTSKVSAPNGSLLNGPKLFEKKLPWRMAPHNGQITLPDGQEIPVGLMTFAAPAGKEKVFFVMAAPSY